MSRRTQIYLLSALLLVLAAVLVWQWASNRGAAPAASGGAGPDVKYLPLSVENPSLRVDMLERIRRFEYSGRHRNVFSVSLPPPLVPTGPDRRTIGPQPPPPPPPLDVPVKFFGYATDPASGRRRAFFTNGEDVYIVSEGETLLGRFRLLHIGNSVADVEETASGRRATLVMEQPGPQG
jgi:hypothetical protein